MHPLLAARARFVLYLAAWVPLLALMSYAARLGSASWLQTAAILAPAVLLFAFACLSPWYICRVQPLQLAQITRLAITWSAAAATSGALLAASAYVTARTLVYPTP